MLRSIGFLISITFIGLAHAVEVRPQIQGSMTSACASNLNCDFTDFGGSEVSATSGQVTINTDYVELNGIHITLTKSRGVKVRGLADPDDNTITGTTLDSVTISYTGFQPASFENQTTLTVIKNSQSFLTSICEWQERENFNDALLPQTANCGASTSGVSSGWLFQGNSSAQALLDGNTFERGWSEGVNCLNSRDMIVRNNTVAVFGSVGIYGDACENFVVEHNILVGLNYGNADNCGLNLGECPDYGSAIQVNVESSEATSGKNAGPLLARNNVLVGTDNGVTVNVSGTARSNGRTAYVEAYGNTIVNSIAESLGLTTSAVDAVLSVFEFKSNISWDQDKTAHCRNAGSNVNAGADYNLWYTNPLDSDCDGANDPTPGAPAGFASYATFEAMSYDDIPLVAEFTPSGAINADPALETETHDLDFDTNFDNALWSEMTTIGVCNDTKAHWNAKLYCDYSGTARNATTPTTGAVE
jgi:hypothetical protein